ncbi:OmpP1/FadL family transporter [Acinetobacter bouvetii]|uniref:Outer membrane protein transport protein (OMPP1/FadL/TodX) n=1 Tax=Acinetobacter bouvetii TaxID=202951 RepID=A0A811GFQ7_9GAMM|nr:outer membrane protein transport protein [Acinetobacter bouvetii]CAB1222874.1 Outer membrane protein transport protein (OMPP1/FadL/TodX) [Acinetobacter bouvetii]
MKFTALRSAILLSLIPSTSVFAAGLDRSGQSISAFLQPGNYAEAGISVLDPTVKGKDNNGHLVGDMGDDYYFPSAAVKVQATDQISLGLLYDQPYGADATYEVDGSDFSAGKEGTKVKVRTNNLTALIGYQPTENWNFYAGPVWQTVEANISLRGNAYAKSQAGTLSGYDIKIDQQDAYGWAAGFAYQIPEIALKAAVTYRSEIKHKADTKETFFNGKYTGSQLASSLLSKSIPNTPYNTDAITPQSVNIDLQTGIAANTLAFANLRWVHWDNFVVTPKYLAAITGALGSKQNLIDYTDDQYSATVGLSHKFNSKWAGTAAVGYDSGAGNPVTTLGPVEGNWSVGLGGQYSPAENYFIQAGVKYFWLGDAQAQTGGKVKAEFYDNHALGYGLKIGYRF